MENNLIELAHTYFDEESYMQLASQEKLNVEKVKKGMQIIIPSLYLGLARKSGADLRQLLDRVRGEFAKIDTAQGLRFPELLDSEIEEEDTDRSSLEFWFDDAYDETLKNTKNFLELDTTSALTLFSSATPAVVAALTGNGDHWDVTTIRANLNNNRDNFLAAIPSDLPLPILAEDDKIPGDKELSETTKSDVPKDSRQIDPVRDVVFADPIIPRSDSENQERSSEDPTEGEHGRGAGWWWIIVPILLLLLWFLFGRGCTRTERPESDAARIDSLITDSVVEKPSSSGDE
ncbi:MAG: hypothetical protein ACTHZ1_06210 [Sphingobacterium sp.]